MNKWGVIAATGVAGIALLAADQNPALAPKVDGAAQKQDGVVRSDELSRITVDVTRVAMRFMVMDKKGRFVTDLGKDDFEVIENKRPQVIQEFTAESGLPLRLGILIDTSNSIRDRFRFEKEAAAEFVRSAMRTNLDRGLVV